MNTPSDLEPNPLVRVMALHALEYCERLFYLEEVEEIRVADDRVFAGRTYHTEIEPEPGEERRSFELASERLGLSGKVDAARKRNGEWVPYEYKRGRAKTQKNAPPEPWESDALQASAYALLLEEHVSAKVSEARIHYNQDNVTIRVPINDETRQKVVTAIARAQTLRDQVHRPPITIHEGRCKRCSLAPVCLPEEERIQADHKAEERLRLFPEHNDAATVHISTPGSKVTRSHNTLVVTLDGQAVSAYPINDVGSIVLHGFTQITTQAITLCTSHEISVHWVTGGGTYLGGLQPVNGVQRRIRQYEALTDTNLRFNLAQRIARNKIAAQLRYLLRISRENAQKRSSITPALDSIKNSLSRSQRAQDPSSLLGAEGQAARAYFSAIPHVISPGVSPDLIPQGRSRRPPRDCFNAVLSFLYGQLYRSVMQAILVVGLDPALGFYHTPRSAAHPLVLDLMELFRVPLVDVPLLGSINRGQWNPKEHFAITSAKVWLNDLGRKLAISLFEQRLQETWKHPILKYSLSYERQLELEVRLLEKEWTGQSGLFARTTLR